MMFDSFLRYVERMRKFVVDYVMSFLAISYPILAASSTHRIVFSTYTALMNLCSSPSQHTESVHFQGDSTTDDDNDAMDTSEDVGCESNTDDNDT